MDSVVVRRSTSTSPAIVQVVVTVQYSHQKSVLHVVLDKDTVETWHYIHPARAKLDQCIGRLVKRLVEGVIKGG
jgi:hypothetical protein